MNGPTCTATLTGLHTSFSPPDLFDIPVVVPSSDCSHSLVGSQLELGLGTEGEEACRRTGCGHDVGSADVSHPARRHTVMNFI